MKLSDIQESLSNDAVRQLADSSIFLGLQGSIGASAISVDEGASLNFTVATGNDATYYYWVEGVSGTVDSADFSSGWADSASRGTVSTVNGIGTFSLTLASDATTDGTETFRVKVSKASSGTEFAQSATVTINDTSLGPSQAQGSNYGYHSGGQETVPPVFTAYSTLDRFPFTADTNATDVGDLSISRYNIAGQSSTTHGYTSGGTEAPQPIAGVSNRIDKFPFASNGTATDIADLSIARRDVAGQISTTHGYTSGGATPSVSNVIDKFPFSSDVNASDVGNLDASRQGPAGQSSTTHGYNSGSVNPSPSFFSTMIDKFPFASDTNATDIANLAVQRGNSASQNSNSHGYTCSGVSQPGFSDIEKFSFATEETGTIVGDLAITGARGGGQSSTTHGYLGGNSSNGGIQKFSFSVDENASNIGNLSEPKYSGAGHQY